MRNPRKTGIILSYHTNSRKRFHLKGKTKNSIKITETSSMLNTDLVILITSAWF